MKTGTRRLTRKQADLLSYIIFFIRSNGFPPSITQMVEATESDKTMVSRRIKVLIERGCIHKAKDSRRSISLITGNGADDLVGMVYLTPARKLILSSIDSLTKSRGEPPSVYAISKISGINDVRVSRNIKYLEENGYVFYDKEKHAVSILRGVQGIDK